MSLQSVLPLVFKFLPQSPVVVQPHEGQISSDAGLLVFAEFDRRWNYSARMADCLDVPVTDPRQAKYKPVTPDERRERLRQRLFGAIAGYEDCNDHDTLRTEPVFKMVAGRLPEDKALASQPTLSRFENAVTARQVARLNRVLVEQFVTCSSEATTGGTPPLSSTA